MNPTPGMSALLFAVVGLLVFGLCLLVRRVFPGIASIDPSPWSSTLSYVATAYGIIVGFSIIFLFGEFSAARQAVGDEATSVGTAFEEVRLFPDDAEAVQHALICYARAVPEYDWPALRDREAAPEVDAAYRDIILALGEVDEPADTTFQPAATTNIFVQVGNISTARETRLVAAGITVPPLLWGLLLGGGALVVVLIFVVTVAARPATQAVLVGLSAMFTAVMVLIVLALATPFAEGGGRVQPTLIEQTADSMARSAPEVAAELCDFDDAG